MTKPDPKKRRVHSPEFKLAAVKRITRGGQKVASVAEELGVSPNLLSRWVTIVKAGLPLQGPGGKRKRARKAERSAAPRKLNLAIPITLPPGLRASSVSPDLAHDRRHRQTLKTELEEVRAERDALQRILARMMRGQE